MDDVEAYLRKNHDRFVKELCDYLRFPSISANKQSKTNLTACAGWLAKHCQQIGLNAELCQTDGNPIVLARTPRQPRSRKPHYLVYGHYDVQPPELLELWYSPPFHPHIEGAALFARGASDNKGQHFAHLKAVEAYIKTGTELPCDLTFIIEGEEEISSPSFAGFLRKHRTRLQCDAVVISDTTLHSLQRPTLSYSLRGICGLEITLYGPSHDLHSGIFGGSVENPAMALCQMLAGLRDERGRIKIPHFYDDVLDLSAFERTQLSAQPFDEDNYKKSLGVPHLFGEAGFTPNEQRSARPTFEINGLTSGYQEKGSKTIIPSSAHAKITMRLVPQQTSKHIIGLTIEHLKRICPSAVRMEIKAERGGDPYLISPETENVQGALDALRKSFGYDPLLIREGGSIPVVNEFKRILKADSLLIGLALPDDNAHSPNEKFSLEVFEKGIQMSACLWRTLPHAQNRKYTRPNGG